MKKMFKRLALVLSLALVASIAVAVPAFAAATPPMTTTLTKNLLMNTGVTVPENFTFTFNFQKDGGLAALTITDQTITIPANATSAANATQTLNLLPILEGLLTTPGLNAGPQDWTVRERVPGETGFSGTPIPGVTYDPTQFRLRVHFANVENPPVGQPSLEIASVEVFRITPGDPNPTFDKTSVFAFNNVFNPDTGTTTDPALRVSKVIAGDRANANLDQLFTFNVTVTAPPELGTAPGPVVTPVLPGTPAGTFTATITMDDATGTTAPTTVGGVSRPTTINFVGGAAEFRLRDGERLNLPTLPGGTSFTVTETGVDNFRPSVVVTEGGTARAAQGPPAGEGYGTNLTTTPLGIIHNVPNPPNNSAAFTNFYRHTPPAGLVVDNIGLSLVAFAAVTLVLLFASRTRKRIEEAPLV